MKLTLESTGIVTTIDGELARLWEGRTESGIAVKVFIKVIAVVAEEDTTEFERELRERLPPWELAMPLGDILN